MNYELLEDKNKKNEISFPNSIFLKRKTLQNKNES